MPQDNTVIVLPETDEETLCVELTGLIRAADHRQNLQDELKKRIEKRGYYKMLIVYGTGFKGWEKDAAQTSLQSIIDLGKYARKLAYVNPPDKKILQNALATPLLSGEIRHFLGADMSAALTWIKS